MTPEQIEQIKIAEFVKQCTDLPFIHIANERKCSPQQGRMLKRMGVKPGVSDIFIPRATQGMHGFWLEVKSESGILSDNQKYFMEQMHKEDYYAEVAYGSEEAIDLIKYYYSL